MIFRIFIATLLFSFLTLTSGGQTISDTAAHTMKTQQEDTAVSSTTTDTYEDEDFSPGLLFFALIGIGLVFICVGIGVALVAFGLFTLFALVSLGILSASILIGLSQRSFAKGFKTFVLLTTCILGTALGATSLYVVNRFLDLELQSNLAVIYGAISGFVGGILLGYISYLLLVQLTNYFKHRLGYT